MGSPSDGIAAIAIQASVVVLLFAAAFAMCGYVLG